MEDKATLFMDAHFRWEPGTEQTLSQVETRTLRENETNHGIQTDSYSLDNMSRTLSRKVIGAENPAEVWCRAIRG